MNTLYTSQALNHQGSVQHASKPFKPNHFTHANHPHAPPSPSTSNAPNFLAESPILATTTTTLSPSFQNPTTLMAVSPATRVGAMVMASRTAAKIVTTRKITCSDDKSRRNSPKKSSL
ncbi:hypothetical protein R6Q59_006262 [Mikania micrantha]